MTYAVLCPGQGAQHAGMLDLLEADEEARHTLEAACAALNADPRAWLVDDTIFTNRIAQPLICIAQLASWRALRDHVRAPLCFAGYSVGELAAYACADALATNELAMLAVRRAQLMQDALGSSEGGLLAIRGLRRAATDQLCNDYTAWTSIVLGEAGVVLGGTRSALDQLAVAATRLGGEIRCLKVGIPAHTPLLQGAVAPFRAALESALRAPAIPVVAGIDGALVLDRQRAVTTLANQIACTIDWARCMDTLHERGCRVFLELGPGSALARMMRERFADVDARSLDDFRSLAGCARWLESRLAAGG
jgi:[acyl-carrier-protein] S-malonyltransferase